MPANLKWRDSVARVASMPWDEIRVRGKQEAFKRWDLALSKIAAPQTGLKRHIAVTDCGRFFFQAANIPEIIECVRRRLPSCAAKIVQSADAILRHRFDLLGYEGLEYGPEIDWHYDAVNGKSAPKLPWYRVPYLAFDEVGDHKVTWELNRHQHLVTLAKAYRLTHNSDYANELIAQWYHWQDRNPYPIGINWASSLEIAFRTLSWLWVWHLLEGSSAMSAKFRLDLMRGLMRNGRHIERYLSTYFAPNTHLLGEAVALFSLGTLAPRTRAVQRWQKLGWKIVLQQAKRQVLPDGMHFEQSTYYHVYAIDFFLHVRILADINGIAIPESFDRTIEKMLDALYVLSRSGAPPQFGDDDGGRVFDPRRNRRQEMLDPLATGAVLFRRPDWKAAVQSPTEEMIWLLGGKAISLFDALSNIEPAGASTALAESGIYILSDGSGQQQLVVDSGPQGMGWAGHGHADALSVQLSIGGMPVLIDPGTFTYVTSATEREHFRGTRAHTTVEVDGESQAVSAGPFKWRNPAHAKAERWINGASFDLFAGSHNGYGRLNTPVIHRRTVFWLKQHFWLVRDVVEGVGTHQINISWSFAPGSLTVISSVAFFRGSSGAALTAAIPSGDNLKYESASAWYSPRYGEKQCAPQLHASAELQLPAECATVLLPGIRANVRFERTQACSGASNAVRGYRLAMGNRVHEMFFSESRDLWAAASVTTDARVLYCSRTSDDLCDRLVACDATHLAVGDRGILSSGLPVEKTEWTAPSSVAADELHHVLAADLHSAAVEEHV